MASKPRKCELVVSFVGSVDLQVAGLAAPPAHARTGETREDEMPIWRLLQRLDLDQRLEENAQILLLDDRPKDLWQASVSDDGKSRTRSRRARFGELLQERIAKNEMGPYTVTVHPLEVDAGDPTNLTGIFEEVKKIRDDGAFVAEWKGFERPVDVAATQDAVYVVDFLADLQ